ncbi:MAG: PQQ-binding-like beta-propeller repeat protein [Planctomycetes bacterium]|nr:PQQ-binding-like beta-propeller repeat protein [Planctomycetota bacterium]
MVGALLVSAAAVLAAGADLPDGIEAGLVVHLHCGDGALTAALRAGDGAVVQGLAVREDDVRRARAHIRERGLYGPVSIATFDGKRLPYADDLVNLLVAEDLGDVPAAEAMRVLAPGGVLCVKRGDRWERTVKARPPETDEWTHFLHDASGNAVSRDRVVGPPRCVRWIAEPRHTRSHEHVPSIEALVSAGGRIFYIADEGPVSSVIESPRWNLVARDAYNGLLLWKRPFGPWYPHLFNWGGTPEPLQRRLVAIGDRVFATLGLHAPVSALDARTGATIAVFEPTRGAEEILWHKGILLVATRAVTDERLAEIRKLERLAEQGDPALRTRDTTQPLTGRFRAVESEAGRSILAVDANTGRVLWKKEGAEVSGLKATSLCADGGRVFFQKGKDVRCLDLATGRERWSVPAGPLRVAGDGALVCADGRTVTALSAKDGGSLWTRPSTLIDIRDAFLIRGSLWLGGFRPFRGSGSASKRGPVWGPYFAVQQDLATGKPLASIEPENPGHHHRCWRNKATERFILGGRRGVEFIDLEAGEVLWHNWVRGVCRYGVMPANGLLYAPPHACGCYIAAKLTGFWALAHGRDADPPSDSTAGAVLERGPAYSEAVESRGGEEDWPTYRHDAGRSGATRSPVPAGLRERWKTQIGGALTGPTVAEGRVFIASVERHEIAAIDAESGRPLWRFTSGARVDSPPTIEKGRAIFGCRDGDVYCLRAADGALAWRLRAAGDARRIVACGRIESASPVHGSILIRDGEAWFAAGRSSYLDGGIALCRVRPDTGRIISKTPIWSPDPETGRQPAQYGPAHMPGELPDILAGDARHVYLRDTVFDAEGRRQESGDPHLLALTGFLDDSWPHRSYWIFGLRCSLATGCSGRDKGIVSGRLLVFDDSTVYGYGRAKVHWSNQLEDGPYRLFAAKTEDATTRWATPLPIRVRAMVLAGDLVFAAGPADEEGGEALLVAVSARDGAVRARHRLDAAPVFDGMAAAEGRLYISLEDGRLVCLGG